MIGAYLDDLLEAAHKTLGPNLVGAYLAGSLALDAYQPGRSDVDVALVVDESVPEPLKRALVTALRHETLPCPARGLELVVYRRAVVRAGTVAPGFEVEVNSGPRMGFRETYDPDDRPAADGHFWYALDRSILHQSGVALFGPPAAEMFADVSDLRPLLIEALTWWLDQPGAEDAVLGACRALAKVRYGEWLSKNNAGRRIATADHVPPSASGLIERSIAARAGGPSPSAREAGEFQRWVLSEIREHPGSAG